MSNERPTCNACGCCENAYRAARQYITFKNPISSEAMSVYSSLREYCHRANIGHRDVLRYVRAEA